MKSKTVGVIVLSLYVCIITLIAIIHTFRCEENYSKTSVSSAGMNSTKTTILTINITITATTTSDFNSTSTDTAITNGSTTNSNTTFSSTTITESSDKITKNRCIYPDFAFQQRIVGGVEAESNIPWQVLIFINNEFMCGGTILDQMTILSAAHCFEKPYSPSIVLAGSTNYVNSSEDTYQVRSVAQNIWHENLIYDPTKFTNDWIILKLDIPLDFNEDVYSACLPSSSDWSPEIDPNNRCFVSGWGHLEYEGYSPDNLQWVEIPAVNNEICRQSYGNFTISDDMICAGYVEGGNGSCQGDSGGPLVCLSGDNAVLTGIVSFGIGCAWQGYYGVYARVTKILDWIQSNIGSTNGIVITTKVCLKPDWPGDGICDDETNNEICEWDGGDCCGESVKKDHCKICGCFDPNYV